MLDGALVIPNIWRTFSVSFLRQYRQFHRLIYSLIIKVILYTLLLIVLWKQRSRILLICNNRAFEITTEYLGKIKCSLSEFSMSIYVADKCNWRNRITIKRFIFLFFGNQFPSCVSSNVLRFPLNFWRNDYLSIGHPHQWIYMDWPPDRKL